MSDLETLVTLNLSGVIGQARYQQLCEKFGDIKGIKSASEKEIAGIDGFGSILAAKLKRALSNDDTSRELKLAEKTGVKIIPFTSDEYPPQLKFSYEAPLVLYVKGNINLARTRSIAIVGSRHASSYGKKMAHGLSYELAGLGFCIVSGLARGIDTEAHLAALKAKGRTIAVMGSGVGEIYPPENKKLSEEISQSGALISEFPIGSEATKTNFPRRNRIVSALSLGTVVVEGSLTSGALITAGFALEQGREVFAVPGPVANPMSRGPHALIKQGAKLVEDVFDILEEIAPDYKEVMSPLERQILSTLSGEPIGLSRLQQKTRIMPNVLAKGLGKLLQKGVISLGNKGYYLRSKI